MKRTTVVMLLVIASTLVLSACGGSAPAADTGGGSGDKIVLRLWSHQDPGFQAANEALIASFMQEHPNIEVQYETFEYDVYIQTLQTSMPAGTEADVITLFGTWACDYANGGRLMPVPENVLTYAQAQDMFYPAPLSGYYCNDQLYGLPHEYNLENGGALMNPALFEAAGLEYPPNWADFNAMLDDAEKMTQFDDSGTMTVSGFDFITGDALAFTFLAGILQQGGDYFAADGSHFNFDTPEARNITQLMVDMVQERKVVDPVLFNDDTNWVGDAFFADKVAIGFVGSWAAAEGPLSYPDFVFDYLEIPPYFGTENRFAADSGWGNVVSVNTEHPDEAWMLAAYMTTNQQNALEWNALSGTIPAMKAVVDNPAELLAKAPYLEATFALLPHGQYIGNLTDRDQLFYEIIGPHVMDALTGVATVDEAVTAINDEANAMVDASQ